jgi:hypothetical protein
MIYVCPEDSSNVDIFIKIVDDNGDPIETDYDDEDLTIEYLKDNSTAWVPITLVTGSYSGYLSGKFVPVPDSDDLYKLSIPAGAINARKSTLLRVTYNTNRPQELVLQFVGPRVYPANWSSMLISSGGKVATITVEPNFLINIPPTGLLISGGGQIYIKETGRELIFLANEDIEELPISLIIELPSRVDKLIVPDEELTKVEQTVTFTLPESLTDDVGSYNWAIRHAETNVLYGAGSFSVSYAPHVDDPVEEPEEPEEPEDPIEEP